MRTKDTVPREGALVPRGDFGAMMPKLNTQYSTLQTVAERNTVQRSKNSSSNNTAAAPTNQ